MIGDVHYLYPGLVPKRFGLDNTITITIAFVALFPISVALFPMLHHEDSDNIDYFPTGLNDPPPATAPLVHLPKDISDMKYHINLVLYICF